LPHELQAAVLIGAHRAFVLEKDDHGERTCARLDAGCHLPEARVAHGYPGFEGHAAAPRPAEPVARAPDAREHGIAESLGEITLRDLRGKLRDRRSDPLLVHARRIRLPIRAREVRQGGERGQRG